LQEAVDLHMGRWLRRGDVFLVFSDGYDTDPPEALGDLLARLHARGVRVCWLHPTKELPQSEAIQGAIPFIHRAMPAHNLTSLARLPDLLRSTLFSTHTHKA
jgi:uncharacterized protein with von Willebrand factor type A (vWA) domain